MKIAQTKIIPGKTNRNDIPLNPYKTALLIIDVQESLTSPDESFLSNVELLLNHTREQRGRGGGCEVIFTYLQSLTEDCRDISLDYKLSGSLAELPTPSNPAKFLPSVQPTLGQDILIPKTSCSVFQSTNLNYILHNLHMEQLVICGQMTNECVESAVRDAADLGYLVTVAKDACKARDDDCHDRGLLNMKGFARIVDTIQILKELSSFFDEEDLDKYTVVKKEEKEEEAEKEEPKESSRRKPSFVSVCKPASSLETGALSSLITALHYSNIKFVRFGVVDIHNTVRCKAVPLHRITSTNLSSLVCVAKVVSAGLPSFADCVTEGSGLDASGNLLLIPDVSSLRMLPYASNSAMVLCYQYEYSQLQQLGHRRSGLCTRAILSHVLQTAKTMYGILFHVGAELEFCLFRQDVMEPVDSSLFAHTMTLNEQEEFIVDLEDMLQKQGIELELIHAESASGQLEVVLKYRNNVMALADDVTLAKETIIACAKKHKKKALFLPKINAMQAGNGLHYHFSFTENTNPKKNAYPHPLNRACISSKGQSFMEGILVHLPALLSLTMPSHNSFLRVGPGCWTGSTSSWAIEDKESGLRVCLDAEGKASHFEFKFSDASANAYLELAAILACGLEGISKKMELRPSMGGTEEEPLPETLSESLECLEKDEFLKDLLGDELCTAYVAIRKAEIEFVKDKTLEEQVEFAYQRA